MPEIAKIPAPPYYAVIFTSIRTEGENGYAETAARMEEFRCKPKRRCLPYSANWSKRCRGC